MIFVILLILKIILAIFLFLIFLLMILLFVPVRYTADCVYDKGVSYNLKATWLLRIISLGGSDEGLILKIFGRSRKGKQKRKAKKTKKATKARERMELTDVESPEASVAPEAKKVEPKTDEPIKNVHIENERSHDDKEMDDSGEKSGLSAFASHVSSILKQPDKGRIIQLTFKLVKNLLVRIMPSEIDIDAVIGFDDPSKTGYTIGYASALAGALGIAGRVRIAGDFEQPRRELQAHIKGELALWSILYPLSRYCLSKPIYKIIREYLRKRREDDGE